MTTTNTSETDCCSTIANGVAAESASLLCTLSPQGRQAAALEWRDLADLAISLEANDTGTVSTFAAEHADQINDLATRENDCCGSWLRADVSVSDDVLTLRLETTSAEGLAVIHAMAGVGPE